MKSKNIKGNYYRKKEDGYCKIRLTVANSKTGKIEDLDMSLELTDEGLMIPIYSIGSNFFFKDAKQAGEAICYVLIDNDMLDKIGERIESRKPKKKSLFSLFK